ncbi:GNAT family N-acetyltransferase [Paenisporosarcina cavernae]|uniref:GNAT family N-acetyltransferase n=1 Tax=Paenisporosarcina cavernae TaxID=2320858 RepID=A0A385YVH7_9BACL|nr:GNAT family N-acetyltransferase [Paenisporosarcina cavernae]AYC30481.1 GNAT family N-acetyltransferase [Paenisporosarcina cavernae]
MSLELRPMDESYYDSYLEEAVKEYAEEKVTAGNWDEEGSLEKSRDEYTRLLPDGVNSKDNFLFTAYVDEQPVGMIWFAKTSPEKAFIYDVKIHETEQGKGYGKQLMLACEVEAKKEGFLLLELHVFGHNRIARNLYERLAYETKNVIMAKKL